MTLRIPNWARFQHYRGRRPPWIKLHRDILDNEEFHCLPDASRALAPMLWLLASESEDGSLPDDLGKIAWRLRMTHEQCRAAIEPLERAGFVHGASKTLARRKQNSIPEKEREIERDTEESKSSRPSAAWSNEACDDWIARFGPGTAPGGKIGRQLKKLVAKHGWERVRPAWQNYLSRTEARYVNPLRFSETFGDWEPPSRAPSESDQLGAEIHSWLKGKGGRDAVAAAIVSSGLSIEAWLEREHGPPGAGPLLSQSVYHAKKALEKTA